MWVLIVRTVYFKIISCIRNLVIWLRSKLFAKFYISMLHLLYYITMLYSGLKFYVAIVSYEPNRKKEKEIPPFLTRITSLFRFLVFCPIRIEFVWHHFYFLPTTLCSRKSCCWIGRKKFKTEKEEHFELFSL